MAIGLTYVYTFLLKALKYVSVFELNTYRHKLVEKKSYLMAFLQYKLMAQSSLITLTIDFPNHLR